MKDSSTIDTFKLFMYGFMRLNLILFIILTTGGLIFAVQTLNNILNTTQTTTSTTSSNTKTDQNNNYTTMFDQTIVNRLSDLKQSANNSNYQNIPSNRINPFSE